MSALALLFAAVNSVSTDIRVNDPAIAYSPFNWYSEGSSYAQTPNPGAYLKLGFTGTNLTIKVDTSTFTDAKVPDDQYPLVRYSIDGGPGTLVQLTSASANLTAASNLKQGNHTLLFQYVSGYVFLDFWTPINAVRVTGFTLDAGSSTFTPTGAFEPSSTNILFLGDSITNGDDDVATFKGGITNAVDTQDATIGYPSVVASAVKAEYGVVAYGGASWESNAADGHTPGLMTFWSMIDKSHSRLRDSVLGPAPGPRFTPIPDEIYVNMGENRPPTPDNVYDLICALEKASNFRANIFIIVPFSGRAREPIFRGYVRAAETTGRAPRVFLLDLGDNPYLKNQGPTLMSVDGQHPLADLHGQLGAQIIEARAKALAKIK